MPRPIPPQHKPSRPTAKFTEFSPYEDGRIRRLKFDVNALADFEQETGMGFAQLMKQKALFGAARAMLWAGLKHEDRALSIEAVGTLLSEYLSDEAVEPGTHTIDSILMVAIEAAVNQGALGRLQKEEPPQDEADDSKKLPDPNVVAGEVVTPETTS